ncbi:MAG: tetraacyldisaccharide 4'-kinase [Deltaproteobacteria bacterium]|nr:tetraacyldisaccharide 4'-kinase [Deltaproteobacteria bacterium]
MCVGNIALGGRAKTPLTAGLVAALKERGFRPGILARGYPRVSRSSQPVVITREGPVEPPWLQQLVVGGSQSTAHAAAGVLGEEAPWLAAVAGAPVAVHPVRTHAAHALIGSHPHVDVLVLDDGYQSAVRCDVDVVVVDPEVDLRGRGALRESPDLPDGCLIVSLRGSLVKKPGGLRDLRTGVPMARPTHPLTLCAAVGDPMSVERTALDAGVTLAGSLRLRDHHGPSARRLRDVSGPILVTEKDAVGWAFASGRDGVVLGLELEGVEAIAGAVARQLEAGS